MKIMRAIEKADALCPNPYTLEEKLDWCDEVTAEIRRNILKEYDVIETEINLTCPMIFRLTESRLCISTVKC